MTSCKQCLIFQKFIEGCFDQESETFTFGLNRNTKLYFGLQVMYAISGIPIDGKSFICDDKPANELCKDLLGSCNPNIPKKKHLQVSKKWLRSNFEVVQGNLNEQLIYYVRTYLLYLVGTKILPNCDEPNYYPAYSLQFLGDVNPCRLNGYAWGANSHCLLTSTMTNEKGTGFRGPTWVYEMFFLERIPKVKDLVLGLGLPDESAKDIPLVKYYSPLMAIPGQRTNNKGRLEKSLEDIRRGMMDEDIVWTPYEKYSSYMPQKFFFSQTFLIDYNKLYDHEPQRGPQQLSITDLGEVAQHEPLVMKSSRGTTERTFTKTYAKYIEMWKERYLVFDMLVKAEI